HSRAGLSAGACWRCCWPLPPPGWTNFTRALFPLAGRRCVTSFLTSPARCFFNWLSPFGWAVEQTALPSDKFCNSFSFRIQQLWFMESASEFSATSWRTGMRIGRAFRVFYQIITDREIYFLLGLAFKDLFRKTKSDPRPAVPVKKRAKAIAAGQS